MRRRYLRRRCPRRVRESGCWDWRKVGLVPPTRIERATRGLGNRCSIQLSYGGLSRMLKKPYSFVLASLRCSTYQKTYASPLRFAAASLKAFLNILADAFYNTERG